MGASIRMAERAQQRSAVRERSARRPVVRQRAPGLLFIRIADGAGGRSGRRHRAGSDARAQYADHRQGHSRSGARLGQTGWRFGQAPSHGSSSVPPILDDLFERTRREARAGAKIVVWSEEAAQILQEDEPLVIERAVALARDEGIYLQMGWLVSLHTEQFPYIQNRALLVDPSGALVWDYAKSHPVPGGETFLFGPGEGIVPNVTTPYGVLATVICFDMNYPTTVRQTGQAATDVLLAPSRDWAAIKVTHAQMHAFRAIENGVSVVRPTENGVGLAVDPMGRILAAQDSFATDKPALVAAVPMRGVATVYARVGDSFAYLSIAALVLLIGGAFVRGRVLRVAAAPRRHFRRTPRLSSVR